MTYAQDNLNLFKELSMNGFEAMRALGALNLQAWEKIAGRQMQTLDLFVETGTREINLVSETKDLNALVNGQVELAKEFGERLVAKGREDLEAAAEVQNDYRAWFEKGVNAFTAKASQAA